MKKITTIIAAAIFISAIPVHNWAKPRLVDQIIAVVNGDIILLSEWKTRYRQMLNQLQGIIDPEEKKRKAKELKKIAFNQMIDEILLSQEAAKYQIQISESEIEKTIEETRKRYNLSPEQFEEAQRKQGYSPKEYREMIRRELQKFKLLRRVFQEKVRITESDERAFYRKMLREVKGKEDEYFVRHILLKLSEQTAEKERAKKRELAQKLLDELRKNPKRFPELAKKYSESPEAAEGGALGWMKRGDLHPELERAMLKTPPGKVYPKIVKTPLGLHILYVEKVRRGGVLSFEEARENIRQVLSRRAFEKAYQKYIKELRKKAVIKIFWDFDKNAPKSS